jgi:hypothetical protein
MTIAIASCSTPMGVWLRIHFIRHMDCLILSHVFFLQSAKLIGGLLCLFLYQLPMFGPFLILYLHHFWLRHCATSRKVAGYISEGFIAIFIDIILTAALWPWAGLSL